MLACKECGRVFDEEDAVIEKEYTGVHSEGFSEAVERCHCPKCGSDYVEEAHRCQFCGEWSAEWLCNDCEKLIRETIKSLVCESARLHRKSHMRFHEAYALNAISDVLEDI